MMKRSLLALALWLLSAPAWALCGVSNLQVKDNAAVTANVPYGDDGSGGTNCNPQVQTQPRLITLTGTGWTSATGSNTTQALMASGGWPALLVQLNQTTTISGGAVTFEGTFDGSNWVSVPVAQLLNPNTLAPLTNPYTLIQSTNQPFLILTQGYQQIRLRLSTTITGTATVTPQIALLSYNPTIAGILQPLAAGTAVIGKVGVDQTTFGTTNGVVSAANTYNTIAASATAQALTGGGGGAAGDYLSHCVVVPATTSPGVVTVLDNSTAIISFAGGASSVSNLVPFALPVGAKSTSGAWKITTGANVSVACVGKFS